MARRLTRPSPHESDDRVRDRGVLGVLRALALIVLVALVVVGGALVAPTFLEATDGVSFGDVETPPPPDERTPAREDPDDPGTTTYDGETERITSVAVEDRVHELVNERRAERGLDPIEWDGTVSSVARAHSADMYEREYFSHQNPDGEDPWDRYTDVANYCRGYGENIATTWVDRRVERPSDGEITRYHTSDELAAGLVEQWMNSPPHREAILTESWDRGGVGVFLGPDGRVYATHNFCQDR